MNQGQIVLCLCLVLFGAVGCYNEPQLHSTSLQVEERAKLSFQSMQNVVGGQDSKRGVPALIGKVGGIADLVHINYSAPPKKVIKAVGDAIVPLIAAGLSLIPGGALIGGLVQGVWGIFSGLIGGPSPMQLMINELRDEIKNLTNDVAALKASLNITIQKQADAKLSTIINRAIHGELRRNQYVCSKYAILSGDFSYDLKHHLPINETLRAEMVAQIHDCDNFLKDTAEAFVYPEYADVLWIPNAITSLVRISFLTEISNYGVVLGIDPEILSMYWAEMKADIKRAIEFYGFGVKKKGEILKAMTKHERKTLGNFTMAEYEGCIMQAQLIYLDGEIYPYGVPQHFHISDNNGELKIADYNVTGNDEPRHIQVYYNEIFRGLSGHVDTLLNCFTGPDRVTRVPRYELSFSVTYVPNKIYEMRVLYFASVRSNRTMQVTEYDGINYSIKVTDGPPSNTSAQRFVFNTAFHPLTSSAKLEDSRVKKISQETYYYEGSIDEGAYVVETVLAFVIQPNDKTTGKISIINSSRDWVYIFGVEFFVLPLVNEL